ncbi:MAG: hypothetical protein WD176_05270 [Pirellulales bacterium]
MSTELVTVRNCSSAEADLAMMLLEQEGIKAWTADATLPSMRSLGWVKVQVPIDSARRALTILRDLNSLPTSRSRSANLFLKVLLWLDLPFP